RAYGVEAAAVERVYALTNDVGLAAESARRGAKSLARTGLALFRPYRFMNAHKAASVADALDHVGGPALFETKYDGARLQIHVRAGATPEVRLYSRRLDDVTASMPDVAASLAKAWRGGDAILEGEAVAFDPSLEEKQPFQAVLSRLGRIHDVEATAKAIPLVLFLFDLVFLDGKTLMATPQRERTERLGLLFRSSRRVRQTDARLLGDRSEAEALFREAVAAGHEGLLVKDPAGVYEPGQRVRTWMKVKPAFETLDVVVVGGIWGTGRRKGLLSSLVVAVRDGGGYATVGKVGTGFSEEALAALTATLEPKVTATHGRRVEVEPAVVIEVDFQAIQKT
ncbi:MAG TPA: ATP-dependent DNA ligase, partial [Anaeromyxobacteraceae bacterium]|nr:ATP-dependent DNA ligase [Anaeromyxobacteraceae bacterium]